ncbi:hypothetical protein GCM10027051_10000 [Niabella terrae]
MRLIRFLFSLYAIFWFVLLMLLIFPFVILASFFGRIRGGNMIYRLCVFWADCWFALCGIRMKKIYEAPFDPDCRQIIIANHISYLDIPVLVKAFRKPLRPLGKIEMTRVPIFGFIYRNTIVTVDRSDASHRAASLKLLRSVLGKGISIFVFPEGTFNETGQPLKSFYNGAFKLAVETGTPIQPVLFLDTYRRMHYGSLFSLNPGRCRVVYLEQVPVSVAGDTAVAQLKEQVFEKMEQKLLQYKAEWVQPDQVNGEHK